MQSRHTAGQTTCSEKVEWPTLALAAVIYACFGLVTWNYDLLPWWLLLPLGGYLVAWHGSLQHEVVHGHPTPWPLVNEALVFPSLWLWMPYRTYQEAHRRHHAIDSLTDPLEDPESYYLSAADWDSCGRLERLFLTASNTLAGRLILGPWRSVWQLIKGEAPKVLRGDRTALINWGLHALGVAVVLYWVIWVCAIPLEGYILFFAYPGLSLTLMRSFLEHRAQGPQSERTVVIEAEAPFALLYLNNNLHSLHHADPWRAWYDLPRSYRARKEALLAANGGYFYKGYLEVMRRYLFTPKEPIAHPSA
jgi:fatty acid desaturase